MIKRIASVAMTLAVASLLGFFATNAEARSYSHRHSHNDGDGGGGTSRSCLTSAARGILNRIESKFGSVRLVSTCRPGATIAGSGRPSRHASGNAVDFEAGNRKGAIVNWLANNHHAGGTMTYADMSHIHVDIGSHFVSLAGGGRRYASNNSRSRWDGNESQRMSLGAGRRKHRSSDDDDND